MLKVWLDLFKNEAYHAILKTDLQEIVSFIGYNLPIDYLDLLEDIIQPGLEDFNEFYIESFGQLPIEKQKSLLDHIDQVTQNGNALVCIDSLWKICEKIYDEPNLFELCLDKVLKQLTHDQLMVRLPFRSNTV